MNVRLLMIEVLSILPHPNLIKILAPAFSL